MKTKENSTEVKDLNQAITKIEMILITFKRFPHWEVELYHTQRIRFTN